MPGRGALQPVGGRIQNLIRLSELAPIDVPGFGSDRVRVSLPRLPAFPVAQQRYEELDVAPFSLRLGPVAYHPVQGLTLIPRHLIERQKPRVKVVVAGCELLFREPELVLGPLQEIEVRLDEQAVHMAL